MLSRFYIIPQRDGQTDIRTDRQMDGQTDRIAISILLASVLTRDSNHKHIISVIAISRIIRNNDMV